MTQKIVVSKDIAARSLIFETGQMAKQANGSVICRYGDTMVLATAVSDTKPTVGQSFFPLTVDYREKYYSAGKIPGGFFKREARPSEKETLTSRMIDRPIRPMFPKAFQNETQVLLNVFSADDANDPDVIAMNAAFAALAVSDLPFEAILGAVRVGLIDSKVVINPTYQELEESRLNLIMAGSKDAIMMVESGAAELSEEEMIDALEQGHQAIREVCELTEQLRSQAGKPKPTVEEIVLDENKVAQLREKVFPQLTAAIKVTGKSERREALEGLFAEAVQSLLPEDETSDEYEAVYTEWLKIYHQLEAEEMRRLVLEDRVRVDGRQLDQIRPISVEVGLIPKTHGSALFTRGETQALGSTTLGTTSDEQIVDNLMPETRRTFYLHYNFPPFCTGEVKRMMGPGRREIGHGKLAERALQAVMPEHSTFPYTVRIVSEILESNGSSSMASVCAGCLSLMDAGVPISAPVAGIAMGLVKEDDQYAILSDILGMEDHLGDMDFKVTGTERGITALQMDIKIGGISRDLMGEALNQAKAGRMHILGKMAEVLDAPRAELKPHAPRIEMMQIDVEKIRDLIGPGGKTIRNIIAETGVKIDVNDEGEVIIASPDGEALAAARKMVLNLTKDVEVGEIYDGKVTRLMNFGAFVELVPGKEGLVHISQMALQRVERVEDVVNVGDEVQVKVIEIDDMGRTNLSMKVLHPDYDPSQDHSSDSRSSSSGRGRDSRGGGGRSGGGSNRGGGGRSGGGRRDNR